MLPMDSDGAELSDVIPMSVILFEVAVQALSCSALHYPLISSAGPKACWFRRNHTIAACTFWILVLRAFPVVCWTVLYSSNSSAGVVSWVASPDVSSADSSNCCFDGLLCLSLLLLSCSFAVLESCSRDSSRRKKNSLISCLVAIFTSRGNRSLTLVSDSVVP